MAFACRIDDLIPLGNGSLEVRYTAGEPPLPASWQGRGLVLASKPDAVDEAKRVRDVIHDDAPILMLAIAAAVNEGFTAQAINKVKGHTLAIDLTQAANVVRLI